MFLKLYAIALPIFFTIDMIWLGLIARGFYSQQIGHLLKDQVNWTAAIIFYLLFIGGIVFFAIEPAMAQQSLKHALVYGAVFGFMTYATYDLTNLATLKDWPVLMAVVDIFWGTILAASVAGISFWIASRVGV